LPIAINLVTADFSAGETLASVALGLVVVVTPIVVILGAVPTITAVVASKKGKTASTKQNTDEYDESQ